MTPFHDAPLLLVMALATLMGIWAILFPTRVTRQFDIPHLSAAGRNEVRAVYGGFGLAMAIMLAVSLGRPDLRAGIYITMGAALAGMAGGRLLSGFLDREIGSFPLFYLGLETAIAALLFSAA